MLSILAEKIHDNRFLRLIKQMLQAGYLEDWEYHDTLSGVPQGGVVSPVLSNIYLHRMDEFVETVLMPEYTRGKRRASNPAYFRVRSAPGAHAPRHHAKARKLRAQQRLLQLDPETRATGAAICPVCHDAPGPRALKVKRGNQSPSARSCVMISG
jgi:retron-type reverse transcriptase